MQGDVREHRSALERVGATTRAIRRPEDLIGLDGLVVPGGESTVMDKLTRTFGLRDPLLAALAQGLPAFGSCAGMILLADRIADGTSDQSTLGGLDITVRRNAFGRQVDSFETDLQVVGLADPLHAVFIRAPWVEQVGEQVQVLARVPGEGPAAGRIVAVRQGSLLATSFHPEVAGDDRIHRMFIEIVTGAA